MDIASMSRILVSNAVSVIDTTQNPAIGNCHRQGRGKPVLGGIGPWISSNCPVLSPVASARGSNSLRSRLQKVFRKLLCFRFPRWCVQIRLQLLRNKIDELGAAFDWKLAYAAEKAAGYHKEFLSMKLLRTVYGRRAAPLGEFLG